MLAIETAQDTSIQNPSADIALAITNCRHRRDGPHDGGLVNRGYPFVSLLVA